MTNTITRNGALVTVLVLLLQCAASAQSFWTETFDSQAAFDAWTNANTGQGAETWQWSTDVSNAMGFAAPPAAFAAPTAATGFAFFNSDANGQANVHDATLTSGPINCSTHPSVGLRFKSQFADFQGSTAQVRVSADGGASWTAYDVFDDQPSYGFSQNALVPAVINVDIPLPAANGQANVLLQFRWEGDWEYGWKLDDIELYDYVAPTANVTFRVNAILLTVDPGGMRINGTFTNGQDEVMTNEGNGIWSITKTLLIGQSVQYKFKNGAATAETVPAACAVSGNRGLTVPATNTTLPSVCFSSCDPCVVPCNLNPDAIICDNFESYNTAQRLGPQSPNWTTWSGTEGGNEDGIVSTEQAASPTKSLKVLSTLANGGPQDVVLNLQNKTTGRYNLTWKFYVPAGKNAYYNIQDKVPIATMPVTEDWNLDVWFDNNGAGRLAVEGTDYFTFNYPYNTWFKITHIVDLDNNVLSFFINDVFVAKLPYPDKLGGVDFFGSNNISQFYIDDVEYINLPPVTFNADLCGNAVDLTQYLAGAQDVPQTTGLFDNTAATVSMTDPAAPDCFLDGVSATNPAVPALNNTQWFTLFGDGGNYHIETVPCNATNYVDDGDTQMAIYEGNDCGNLVLIDCNDDLDPQSVGDFRAGLDLQTEAGTNYYMLIDGWSTTGFVANGQYCIEITRIASVTCAQGSIGTYTVDNGGFICVGSNLADLITLSPTGYSIPTQGPIFGMAWAVTAQPVPADTWPADLGADYLTSTGFIPTPFAVILENDGSFNGVFYITPVIVGGGVDTEPADAADVGDVDPTGGCFFVGESVQVVVMPPLDPLTVTGQVTNATVPPGNNGAINITVDGGFGAIIQDPSIFFYDWSNGGSTQDLTGLAPGSYTVTVADPTNCTDPVTATFTVGQTSGATDPASVKALTLSPNPTTGAVLLNLSLEKAAEVRVEVINTLGQVLQQGNAGKVTNLLQPVDLSALANGAYFIRVTIDGETAIRRVAVQR